MRLSCAIIQLSLFHQNFKNFFKQFIAYSDLPNSFFAPSQNWNVTTNNEDKIKIPDAYSRSSKIQFCSRSEEALSWLWWEVREQKIVGEEGGVIFKRL